MYLPGSFPPPLGAFGFITTKVPPLPIKNEAVIRDTPKLSVTRNHKGQIRLVSHPELDLFRNDTST